MPDEGGGGTSTSRAKSDTFASENTLTWFAEDLDVNNGTMCINSGNPNDRDCRCDADKKGWNIRLDDFAECLTVY